MNIANTELYTFLSLGGPVMVPLIGISLWMWLLIFERYLSFWLLKRPASNISPEILSFKPADALKKLDEKVFEHFSQLKYMAGSPDISHTDVLIKKEKRLLKKNLSTINTLAVIAPLLGLLGTVLGMVTTFDVISAFGTGNAKAMAEGISAALITTQTGLLVAVPGLFMGTYLSRTSKLLEAELDDLSKLLKRAAG